MVKKENFVKGVSTNKKFFTSKRNEYKIMGKLGVEITVTAFTNKACCNIGTYQNY